MLYIFWNTCTSANGCWWGGWIPSFPFFIYFRFMSVYTIPLKYRKMENLHIVFWIFKDIGWCLLWKPLGIVMIFPTLIISIIIAWRTRHMMAELTHNLAITLWIVANSYWMSTEFLGIDTLTVLGQLSILFCYLVTLLKLKRFFCSLWLNGQKKANLYCQFL